MDNKDGDPARTGVQEKLRAVLRADTLAEFLLYIGSVDAFTRRVMRVDKKTSALMDTVKDQPSPDVLNIFSIWLNEVWKLFLDLVTRPLKGEKPTFIPKNFPEGTDGSEGVYETLPYTILQNAPEWWKMLDGQGSKADSILINRLTNVIGLALRLVNGFDSTLISGLLGPEMLQDLLEAMPASQFQFMLANAQDSKLQAQLSRTALNNFLSNAHNPDAVANGQNPGWDVVSGWGHKIYADDNKTDHERTQAAVQDQQLSEEVAQGILNLKNSLRNNGLDILREDQATRQQLEQVLWIIENQAIRSSSEIGQQVKELARWMVSKLLKTDEGSKDKLGTTAIRLWLAFDSLDRPIVLQNDCTSLNLLINKNLASVTNDVLVYRYLKSLFHSKSINAALESDSDTLLPTYISWFVMRFYDDGMTGEAFEFLDELILSDQPRISLISSITKVVLGEWYLQLDTRERKLLAFNRLKERAPVGDLLESVSALEKEEAEVGQLVAAVNLHLKELLKTGDVNGLVTALIFLVEKYSHLVGGSTDSSSNEK